MRLPYLPSDVHQPDPADDDAASATYGDADDRTRNLPSAAASRS
jgi:hypothetical protein